MINVIFDLSNIVYRSMFNVSNYGMKPYTFDTQQECDQLMRKIAIDTSFIMRSINPSRVIFALDSRSWRKQIKIEENEGYKGTREKSKNLNWDNIYKSLDEFSEIMKSNGYIITKIENAEADDVVALWNNELQNIQHQHVIIISGDEDIRQLVKSYNYNNKETFTTVFNPFLQGKNSSKKLYYPNGFMQWLNKEDECDIFNLTIDVDKEDFKKLQKLERVLFEEVNGNLIMLRKIFCGDDGDNIPAIFTWYKNDKEVRFTNSKFEKILEVIGNNCSYNQLYEKSNIILDNIIKITKETPPFNFDERLKRQVKLVVLDSTVFPEQIIHDFNKEKNIELNKPKTNNTNINMHQLLANTKYVSEKVNNKASIFSEIDKIQSRNSLF